MNEAVVEKTNKKYLFPSETAKITTLRRNKQEIDHGWIGEIICPEHKWFFFKVYVDSIVFNTT